MKVARRERHLAVLWGALRAAGKAALKVAEMVVMSGVLPVVRTAALLAVWLVD